MGRPRRWPDLLWGAGLAVVGYTYVGYPLLLALVARLAGRQPLTPPAVERGRPGPVSIVIPAHNEAEVLEQKLANTVAAVEAESPGAEVILVSDGSDDGTDELASRWADRGVQLVRQPRRSGKGMAMNRGVGLSRGELLVFMDANTLIEPGALAALLEPFADPRVGVVGGAKRILPGEAMTPAQQENWYWRYEDWLKRRESRLGMAAGADGAFWAMRRAYWRDLGDDRAGQDFFPSLRAVAMRAELRYAPNAVAWEHTAPTISAELGRKDRTLGSGLVSLWRLRGLLGPRHPREAWILISHRLLRFAVLPALGAVLLGTSVGRGRPARLMLGLQVACYAGAAAGALSLRLGRRPPGLLLLPTYFLALHYATLRAMIWALRPRGQDLWAVVPRQPLDSTLGLGTGGRSGGGPLAGLPVREREEQGDA